MNFFKLLFSWRFNHGLDVVDLPLAKEGHRVRIWNRRLRKLGLRRADTWPSPTQGLALRFETLDDLMLYMAALEALGRDGLY